MRLDELKLSYLIVFLCVLGQLTIYIDGQPAATPFNVGQTTFAPNLDLVTIGSYFWFYNVNSIASAQFYLRPLSQPEIVLAMNQSYTMAYNPKCDFGQ